MSLLRNVVLTALFCLFFCFPELYAISSNELKLEKPQTSFSLDGLGKSLNGTVEALGKTLDGTVNGIGKSLNGAAKGIGESLGGTVDGVGEFLEDNGEAIIAVGIVALFVIADCYCYDSGHYHGHNHGCHR